MIDWVRFAGKYYYCFVTLQQYIAILTPSPLKGEEYINSLPFKGRVRVEMGGMVVIGANQIRALQVLAPGKGVAELAAQQTKYQATIARYQVEEEEMKKTAKSHEKEYDNLNYRDDQFDLSDAVLSICLGMLGVTALTNKRKLLYLFWFFAGFGLIMGLAGLLGLPRHPDILTKLSS